MLIANGTLVLKNRNALLPYFALNASVAISFSSARLTNEFNSAEADV